MVALGGFGGQGERVGDAALSQWNLEGVLALRLRAVEGSLRCLQECLIVGGFAVEKLFCLQRTPGFRPDSSERYADENQLAAANLGHNGRGGESKFVGGAVAQFQVDLPAVGLGSGQGDKGDQLAWLKNILPLRGTAGSQEEFTDGNLAFAFGALDVNGRFQSSERDVVGASCKSTDCYGEGEVHPRH